MLDDLDGTGGMSRLASLPAAGDPAGQPAPVNRRGSRCGGPLVAARRRFGPTSTTLARSRRGRRSTSVVLGADSAAARPGGPRHGQRVDDPSRRAGWAAAVNYLELLAGDASRIRRCAHPECVLYSMTPARSAVAAGARCRMRQPSQGRAALRSLKAVLSALSSKERRRPRGSDAFLTVTLDSARAVVRAVLLGNRVVLSSSPGPWPGSRDTLDDELLQPGLVT